MDFKELGGLLRQERMQQGLAIDDIVFETKISPLYIKAIEQGHVSMLPAPVFIRGFMRSYARVLHLDTPEFDAAVKAALASHQAVPQRRPGATHTPSETPASGKKGRHPAATTAAIPYVRRRLSTNNVVIVLAVFIAVLFIGLAATLFWDTPPLQAPQDGALSAKPQVGPTAAPGGDLRSGDPAPALGPEPASEVAGLPPAIPSSATDTQETSPSEPPEEAEVLPGAAAAPALPQQLEILAQAACWMRIWPDDQPFKDYLLKAGDRLTVTFNNAVQIRFGNAGGVSLHLNGEPYAFEVQPGGVQTVHIF